MKKQLQIANGFFLVFTIVFNYLSNTGIFNDQTIADVSKQYHNLFTPAGYAFSIWGVIYLLLTGFVFYTGRSLFSPTKKGGDHFVVKIGWWFVVSCLANCVWILTWLYDYTSLSILVLLVVFISLVIILLKVLNSTSRTAEKCFINIPFQIYTGWVSVALIAAVAAWLTKIDWNRWGISEITWTITLIIVASLIHLFMTWKKNAPLFALVAVWSFIAIAVANKEGSQEIYFSALTAAVLLFLSSAFKLFKKSKSLNK